MLSDVDATATYNSSKNDSPTFATSSREPVSVSSSQTLTATGGVLQWGAAGGGVMGDGDDARATAVLVSLSAESDDVLTSGRLDAVRQARQFCDTVIETGGAGGAGGGVGGVAGVGRSVDAHACVLAAASPMLRSLLLRQKG